MSNELATHLTYVFNALKTLRSFTSLNEIKQKKKPKAFKPVALKLI
jgi:hypothetical protein